MKRPSYLSVLLCVPLVMAFGARARANTQLELSAGSEYSSFKLAEGSTSSVWYAPFSARLDLGNWSLRATVPYLSIRAPANLIALLDDDPTGAGSGGQARPVSGSAGYKTVSGIGDASLAVSYSFNAIADTALYADLGARVRLPTGDAGQGTGVGATDYGVTPRNGSSAIRARPAPISATG